MSLVRIFATLFLFLHASLGFAQTTAVTPNQLRILAANAVIAGDPITGYQATAALLRQDPNDVEALIIQARAARDLGKAPEAIKTAQKAWNLADTPSEKFGSSVIMAQALSTSGRRTAAQFWLRRAMHNAPNEKFKASAVRDFKHVQRINPWSTELNFSISPSSNINNGSMNSTVKLFDLPFDFQLSGAAQALSGMQYSAGFATRYRLSENTRSQNDIILQASHRTYTMSTEAKQLAPTAKGSDFAFTSTALNFVHRGFTSATNDMPYSITLTGGRSWYAQQPYLQYGRIAVRQNFVIAPGVFVHGGAHREKQVSLTGGDDAQIWGISAGIALPIGSSDRLNLSLSRKRSLSDNSDLDFQKDTLSARYQIGKPVLGMRIDFGMSYSRKTHEVSRFTRFGRQDQTLSADVTAVITGLNYYGFSPTVTLSARQNDSNIGLYEARELGVQVGIRSAF